MHSACGIAWHRQMGFTSPVVCGVAPVAALHSAGIAGWSLSALWRDHCPHYRELLSWGAS